nr:twin-arginine translocase subunit TatC [Fundidesulfovibrio soli]
MSLLDHLEELRTRLIRVIFAAVIGFAACFAFAEKILDVMLKPLKEVLPPASVIQTTGLTEGFFVSMKAAFVCGIFLASPYIFYQIWSFIAPGLYEEERKLAIPVAFFTALCFVAGACFGYFIVFPFGFTFLANYASDIITLQPKLSEYYSLALGLLFAFGIIFEMPVFIFFLARFGVVDHKWLRAKRRWAIVIFFVIAAVLTPTPDVVNQILMAAPMVVLYEVGIWVAYFFGKRPTPPAPEEQPEEGQPAVEQGAETPAVEAAPEQAPEASPETAVEAAPEAAPDTSPEPAPGQAPEAAAAEMEEVREVAQADQEAHTAAELAYGETSPQTAEPSAELVAEPVAPGPDKPDAPKPAEAPAEPDGKPKK